MSTETEPDDEERPVSIDVQIDKGRTEITVTGDRDAAIIVRSQSGERVYLPPEDFERPPKSKAKSGGDTAYQPAASRDSAYQSGGSGNTAYQSVAPDASPYDGLGEQETPVADIDKASWSSGLHPTDDGFVIVHPEPVVDLRILR